MNFAEKRTKREALFSLTSPEMERLKKLGEAATPGEQRFLIALKMSDESVKLAQRKIRDEHPDWSENEVMLDYFRWVFFPQQLTPGMVEAILNHPRRSQDPKQV
jgi:hypothetical protein